MSVPANAGPAELLSKELETLRRYSWLMLVVGVLLIIVGMVAISSPFVPTLATVIFVGCFLLVGGVMEVVNAFWAHAWRGFWMHLLAGILYLVLGLFLVERPLASAAAFAARYLLGIAVNKNNLKLAEWCLTHGANPNAAPPPHPKAS